MASTRTAANAKGREPRTDKTPLSLLISSPRPLRGPEPTFTGIRDKAVSDNAIQGADENEDVSSPRNSHAPTVEPPTPTINDLINATLSATEQKSERVNFITRLFRMINDPASARYIGWSATGDSFIVYHVGEFGANTLPEHFKHNNFPSIVRQLNMYGFNKINLTPRSSHIGPDAYSWEFSHPRFHRDHPEQLQSIKRKVLEDFSAVSTRDATLEAHTKELSRLSEQMKELVGTKPRVEEQTKQLCELRGQVAHISMQEKVIADAYTLITAQNKEISTLQAELSEAKNRIAEQGNVLTVVQAQIAHMQQIFQAMSQATLKAVEGLPP
ncbi:hypothetical protein EIP91_008958 [Steccherinum ochraceum]|uniref:HSF-type DNA-binding domain-containing protein n=1 Tax=Steccherinum ochraceum TaxID=92696 RepID=A0A4R0RK58_9APHY|nr:hypothetical protein EIP91_008958 [Steccherinum ochraceum]